MKKLTALLIILMVATGALFAAVFQIGPTVSYTVPLDLSKGNPVDFAAIDLRDFTFGGDLRINMAFLQAQAEARSSFDKDLRLDHFELYGAGALRFDLVVADVTLGGGVKVSGVSEDGRWTFNGKDSTEAYHIFTSSELYYKAGLALNFGRVSFSTEVMAPLDLSLSGLKEEKMQSVLGALTPDLKRTQVSLGFLINIF
ncbi:MAG: hypothetical protein KBS81_07830 [Spirochaetales bacterium]|nr:hypothetical protein [Candidatus Physcosoma equi]